MSVKVLYSKTAEDILLKMDGHALHNPGNDIVCAGISALAYTAIGACKAEDLAVDYEANSGDFYLRVILSQGDQEAKLTAEVIMDTIYIGLKQIEMSYPDNISIETR